MKIEVTNCYDCPFRCTEYDTECVGYDTYDSCNLLNFNRKTDDNNPYQSNSIAAYDSLNEPDTPQCDYCNQYWEDYHNNMKGFVEPEFDESKCQCEKIRQDYLDSLPKEEFKTPDFCPLRNIKNIIITPNIN